MCVCVCDLLYCTGLHVIVGSVLVLTALPCLHLLVCRFRILSVPLLSKCIQCYDMYMYVTFCMLCVSVESKVGSSVTARVEGSATSVTVYINLYVGKLSTHVQVVPGALLLSTYNVHVQYTCSFALLFV